jgi:hypothetical protein
MENVGISHQQKIWVKTEVKKELSVVTHYEENKERLKSHPCVWGQVVDITKKGITMYFHKLR